MWRSGFTWLEPRYFRQPFDRGDSAGKEATGRMELSTREHIEGKLSEEQLARALETLRTDGYVVLERGYSAGGMGAVARGGTRRFAPPRSDAATTRMQRDVIVVNGDGLSPSQHFPRLCRQDRRSRLLVPLDQRSLTRRRLLRAAEVPVVPPATDCSLCHGRGIRCRHGLCPWRDRPAGR